MSYKALFSFFFLFIGFVFILYCAGKCEGFYEVSVIQIWEDVQELLGIQTKQLWEKYEMRNFTQKHTTSAFAMCKHVYPLTCLYIEEQNKK